MSAIGETIPRSLYTTICPNCAYSLIGLPETGTCPECGRLIDQGEIVLYGHASGRRRNLANVKTSGLIWLLFPLLAWLAMMVQDIYLNRRGRFQFQILIGMIFLIQGFYWLSLRQRSGFPGRIQIRLNDRGCVQYDALPKPTLFYELFRTQSWLIPGLLAIGLYVGFRLHLIDEPWIWICCPLLLIAAFFLWFECRRIRRLLATLGDNAMADANAAFYPSTRWQRVRYFQLLPLKPELFRLR